MKLPHSSASAGRKLAFQSVLPCSDQSEMAGAESLGRSSRRLSTASVLALVLAVAALSPASGGARITAFDVNGALSTEAVAINAGGVIVGNCDIPGHSRGFIRAADGTIATFDIESSQGTFPWSINRRGAIAGNYFETIDKIHGFVRSPRGKIKAFDPPGASKTFAFSINDAGTITGEYVLDSVTHGFVRDA